VRHFARGSDAGVGESALGTAQPPIDGCRAESIKARATVTTTSNSRPNRSVTLYFSWPSTHSISVAAWIRDLEPRARTRLYSSPLRTCKRRQPDSRKSPRPRKKIRRVVLGEMAANEQNTFMLPPRTMHRARKRALTKSACARPRRPKINANFPTTRIRPTISMMRCLARTARS
jgi:hypothetical protein